MFSGPLSLRAYVPEIKFNNNNNNNMQSFIISHSSCAEQYGDMSSDTQTHSHTIKCKTFFKNCIGSLGHHQNMTHCWHHGTRHRAYVQSFIISHPSCAEQYGDMSSDTQTHSHRIKQPAAGVQLVTIPVPVGYNYQLSRAKPGNLISIVSTSLKVVLRPRPWWRRWVITVRSLDHMLIVWWMVTRRH